MLKINTSAEIIYADIAYAKGLSAQTGNLFIVHLNTL